ncbi:RhuM family protein [Flavobacterium sp.]|uniref:RhuM family protein n=1 Tax=Flavobacterium sp. TaxID=239 RepID=UPI0035AE8B78
MENNILIPYTSGIESQPINVLIENDTVWLTQLQMVQLFQSTKQNISLHIANIFKEGELEENSVVKEYLTTATDGKKYKTKLYNLDVIISVGYRVKSKTGTQFRIWANKILKDYLLKGYAINHRIDTLEQKVSSIEIKNKEFQLLLNTNLPLQQGVFFEGELFDAHVLISKIIKSAQYSILLFDNYIDQSVLIQLANKNKGVTVKIYTKSISKQLQLDVEKFNKQYDSLQVFEFNKAHDRFLIIDQTAIYHLGASLKDLGKKWFAFSKLHIDPALILGKLDS